MGFRCRQEAMAGPADVGREKTKAESTKVPKVSLVSAKINLPHLDDSAEKAGTYRQKFGQIGANSTKFEYVFYFFLDLMTASESAHFREAGASPSAAYQELALAPASWNTVWLKRYDFTE